MMLIPATQCCDKVRYHADTMKYKLNDRSIVHIQHSTKLKWDGNVS